MTATGVFGSTADLTRAWNSSEWDAFVEKFVKLQLHDAKNECGLVS